jgi:putative transposase
MCRGNARRSIFLDDDDRYRFIKLLYESMKTYHVVLYVYAMMDNHFHLVVQTIHANLGEFMRRFNICYTGWFHYRHGTCGHLYQGRYKSILVDADSYLLALSRYVHFNPISGHKYPNADYRDRLSYLRRYRWSSLPGYLDKRRVNEFVQYDMILGIIGGRSKYGRFMAAGLRDGIGDLLRDVKHQTILGDENFVALVKNKFLEDGSSRDQPAYRGMLTEIITPEEVLLCVSRACGVPKEELLKRRGDGICRGLLVELLYRHCGMTMAAIGRFIGGIDYGGVHQLRRRLKFHMSGDRTLRDRFDDIDSAVKNLCSK